MADQFQYKQVTDEYGLKDTEGKQPPQMVQPPPYGMASTYPQGPGAYDSSPPVVVATQPAPANNVIMMDNSASFQPRPSHALAIGTLIFAIVTLIVTFPISVFCTVPAIILSSLALARDYRVEEAKAYSMASLVLTIVFYIFLIITIIVVVIIVVVAAKKAQEITPYDPFDPYDLFDTEFSNF